MHAVAKVVVDADAEAHVVWAKMGVQRLDAVIAGVTSLFPDA